MLSPDLADVVSTAVAFYIVVAFGQILFSSSADCRVLLIRVNDMQRLNDGRWSFLLYCDVSLLVPELSFDVLFIVFVYFLLCFQFNCLRRSNCGGMLEGFRV